MKLLRHKILFLILSLLLPPMAWAVPLDVFGSRSALQSIVWGTNAPFIFINSNSVTGVRGVIERPYPYFQDGNSNALSGDTIVLLGPTTITNSALALGETETTNLNILGFGQTLTLVNTVQQDQIWLNGNVRIQDLVVTNTVNHPSFYTFLMTAVLTNLFMDNVEVYAHGPCIYADDSTKIKTLNLNNSRFWTDCQTNANIAFGGGNLSGRAKNCEFLAIGPTNNWSVASASNMKMIFENCLLVATNGNFENLNFETTDGGTNIFKNCTFQVHKSQTAYVAGTAGDAAIVFTGYTVPQDHTFNDCTFSLNANGNMALLVQEINYDTPGNTLGTMTFNNCYYVPETNGVIVVNGGSSYIVRGGNLGPANFSDPTKVTFVPAFTPNVTGANQAGNDNILRGGKSTGTGRGGAVRLQTSPSGSSGSTANTLVDRTYISAKEVTLTESAATLVFNASLASGKSASFRIFASTRADDATDFQMVSEEFVVAAVNKAGTVTTTVSASSPSATRQSSGTLTTAWTAVANGNGVDFKNSAVSSLTQTTLVTRWRCDSDSNDTGLTVTPQ